MKSGLYLLAFLLIAAPIIAADQPIDIAYKKALVLEKEHKNDEVIKILLPFADSKNRDVEFALANAILLVALDRKPGEKFDPANVKPALDFAQSAAEHGSSGALNLLYVLYSHGLGVAVDDAKAIEYLRRAVVAGDSAAKLNYAEALYMGSPGVPKNVEHSCPLFDELFRDASIRQVTAYYEGLMEFFGQCGKKVDRIDGIRLIKISADQGMRAAEHDMGKNFEFGWTGPIDKQKAFNWYEKAADHGDSDAQWWIGMAYVDGELRPKDSVKGVQYLEESAASNDPRGLTDLGVMYINGDGVKKDYEKARSLYERAAALNQPHAYRELASMYAMGEGVPFDLVRSRVLYMQSIELGEKDNPGFRKAIESKLDAGQIKESDKQVEEWKKHNTIQ